MNAFTPKSILAMARSGATQRAWDAFAAAKLDERREDPDALTLKGRLLKDRARQAAGEKRSILFAEAGAAYEQAAAFRADSYPLINAAAMALFAGDRVRAELFATKVQHMIESGADSGETPYWGEATRAEALLLLGRMDDAKTSLARAIALAPQAWEDHAATLGQFAALLAEMRSDLSWLDPLRPPSTLHFSGILGIATDDDVARSAIAEAVARISPGFAYGALAAGADIIAAEAVVAGGAELHVVLPSDPAEFRQTSVDPFGYDWARRFDRLMDIAHSVVICGQEGRTTEGGVRFAEYQAMGLAIEKAEQLKTQAVALRIEPADRIVPADPWTGTGRPLEHVAVSKSNDDIASPLPASQLWFDIAIEGETPQSFDSLFAAVEILRSSAGKGMAIDCRIGDHIQIAALSARAEAGLVIASREAALALLAAGMASRIEVIGEMASNHGPLTICLVTLNADRPAG
ncbi:MAG: tetratricopeptide repeat-containing protein [Sphingorhabdus sp.]